MKLGVIIGAALSLAAQTAAPPPPQLYVNFLQDGKWVWKVLVIQGATLDTTSTPAVLKIAPAIVAPQTYKFNGPWLQSKNETDGSITVGLMPGRIVEQTFRSPATGNVPANYSLTYLPATDSLQVHVNGVRQEQGKTWTYVSTSRVVMFAPGEYPANSSDVVISYRTHQ
jgi:hypothetical protein